MVRPLPRQLLTGRRIAVPEVILVPLLAFTVSRLLLFVVGYFSQIWLGDQPGIAAWHAAPDNLLLDMWARWDSGFYMNVTRDGYSYIFGEQSSVAFFPLYPLLMKLGSSFGSRLVAGAVISNLCFLTALFFLYKLTRLELGATAARRAVIYLAFFPSSFFFSSVYTESTFLLCAVAAYYFARTGRWGIASTFGMLMAATRITGVVMFGVLGLEWLRTNGFTLSKIHKAESWRGLGRGLSQDRASLLAICTIPLGLLSYILFLHYNFSDGLAFMTVQAAWERETLGPVAIVIRDVSRFITDLISGDRFYYEVLLDVSSLFWGLIMGVIAWRRLGTALGIYVISSLLVPAASATQSLVRYVLVLFPVFMMLGLIVKREWLHRAILVLFTVLMCVVFALHANWYFVA